MGWNYRKSVNLGGGLRLNFSKSGVGISGGVKGFRVSKGPRGSRLYASIPGTGIYYTKSLGRKKNSNTNSRSSTRNTTTTTTTNTGSAYQYSQVVTNDYTGETRELRARTQFELNQLVEIERERQLVNEQRQKRIEIARDRQQQVDAMNEQIVKSRNELNQLINYTLSVDDRINWNDYMMADNYVPFQFNERPPEQKNNYKIGFIRSLFTNEKKFEVPDVETAETRAYEARRNAAISDYLQKKAEYEKEKNKKNGEMLYLKQRFEESDKEAVERYISIVLTKSKYPVDFEHDFEIRYLKDYKKVIINFLFQDIDSFPITERYEYNRETEEINEIMMQRDNAVMFYTRVLYSVGIRTIDEVFESVYTDAVDSIIFNGYIEDEDNGQCAFSIKTEKNSYKKIDLRQDINEILTQVEFRTIDDFTSRSQILPFE